MWPLAWPENDAQVSGCGRAETAPLGTILGTICADSGMCTFSCCLVLQWHAQAARGANMMMVTPMRQMAAPR